MAARSVCKPPVWTSRNVPYWAFSFSEGGNKDFFFFFFFAGNCQIKWLTANKSPTAGADISLLAILLSWDVTWCYTVWLFRSSFYSCPSVGPHSSWWMISVKSSFSLSIITFRFLFGVLALALWRPALARDTVCCCGSVSINIMKFQLIELAFPADL